MPAYYNEIEPYAAQWLRNLIAAGHIAPGEVDERSIVDVRPDDLRGFDQCHFFAGIGGWSCAARLAGWPDNRPLWTGSCPCQPFSGAGDGLGLDDPRHLWPEQFRLIRACRPAVFMGEQVARAIGKGWLDIVLSDLESIDYTARPAIVPARAVGAQHYRDRLWLVADTGSAGLSIPEQETICGAWRGQEGRAIAKCDRWPAQPGVGRVAYGIPGRVGQLRALGNAIVPQVAAEIIAAYMECQP